MTYRSPRTVEDVLNLRDAARLYFESRGLTRDQCKEYRSRMYHLCNAIGRPHDVSAHRALELPLAFSIGGLDTEEMFYNLAAYLKERGVDAAENFLQIQ